MCRMSDRLNTYLGKEINVYILSYQDLRTQPRDVQQSEKFCHYQGDCTSADWAIEKIRSKSRSLSLSINVPTKDDTPE
jgi:hypothetical protein